MPGWLVLSLLTTLVWGASTASFKRSFDDFSPATAIVFSAIAALVIITPFALMNHAKFIFWPLIPVGILAVGCYTVWYYALDQGQVALTGTLLGIYPLISVILSFIILHEHISFVAKLGVAAVIGGLLLLSLEPVAERQRVRIGSWALWGLAGAVTIGLGDFLAKLMINISDPYSYLLAFVFGWLLIAVIVGRLDRRMIWPNLHDKASLYLAAGEVLLFVGYIFFYTALKTGLGSIVIPISAGEAIVAFVLALVWLKEKITKAQFVGAIVAIIGIILVSRG